MPSDHQGLPEDPQRSPQRCAKGPGSSPEDPAGRSETHSMAAGDPRGTLPLFPGRSRILQRTLKEPPALPENFPGSPELYRSTSQERPEDP